MQNTFTAETDSLHIGPAPRRILSAKEKRAALQTAPLGKVAR